MNGRVGFRVAGAIVAGLLIAGVGVGVSGGLVTTSSQPQPNPTLTVTPHANLVDLQSVQVVGSHFSPNAFVASVQCTAKALDVSNCDLGTLVYSDATPAGAVVQQRAVRRIININGAKVDCAKTACILGMGNVNDFSEAAGAPISFDPAVPPVVTKIVAHPATGLRDHQLVNVTGQGFTPGSSVEVVECTPDGVNCAYETVRYADVSGTGTISISKYALERKFLAFNGNGIVTIDCAATPKTCVLQAFSGGLGGGDVITAPLAFDPNLPLAVPAITVKPSTQLGDLNLVSVVGKGFFPGATVSVAECAIATFACSPEQQSVTAGFQGQFILAVTVHRRLAGEGPGGVAVTDCAKHTGICAIVTSAPGALEAPSVKLSFDPSKRAIPSVITADRLTELVDNQKLRLTLSGFARYRPISIIECSAEAVAEQDLYYCDSSTQTVASTPAASGLPSTQMYVHKQISSVDGLVDCAAREGACVLVAVPYQFYPFGGGGPGASVVDAGGGLTAAKAPPNALARPTTRNALPTPAVVGRPLAAAAGSTIPGIATLRLNFRR
jgi:hypothetical protein